MGDKLNDTGGKSQKPNSAPDSSLAGSQERQRAGDAVAVDTHKVNEHGTGSSIDLGKFFRDRVKDAIKGTDDWARQHLHVETADPTKGPGWHKVDLSKDSGPFAQLNKLLASKDPGSYNCKYFVKSFIEGRCPDENGHHTEIDQAYLKQHGYELVKTPRYEEGDIVLLRNLDKKHLALYAHAGIVEKTDAVAGRPVSIIQKPDDDHPVSRCTLEAFRRTYGLESGETTAEIYRKSRK